MKPLTIFEKHPSADAYRIGDAYEPYAVIATDKRFTDAELMSEFHSARADYSEASKHISLTYWTPLGCDEDATHETALKRSVYMLHFAMRPHYDEAEE